MIYICWLGWMLGAIIFDHRTQYLVECLKLTSKGAKNSIFKISKFSTRLSFLPRTRNFQLQSFKWLIFMSQVALVSRYELKSLVINMSHIIDF